MDTGDTRYNNRGGGRRGRYRARASRNYYQHQTHYDHNSEEPQYHTYEDPSQKDGSFPNDGYNNPYMRGRGRGRGGRGFRGGYRATRGRNRGGGEYHSYAEEYKKPQYKQDQTPPIRFAHAKYQRRDATQTAEEHEEGKVYYQAEDFIKKYDKLPEKTEYLVKELCGGTMSCSICHNEIVQISAIWNCRQ